MYEKQLLIHKWQEEIGEFMCDEMKLQEDILFNVFSNKMVGFTKDLICKEKTIKNILDEDKLETFCELAKCVNLIENKKMTRLWFTVHQSLNGHIKNTNLMHIIANVAE